MICRLFCVFLVGFLSIRADDSDDGPAQVSALDCKSLLDVVVIVDGSDSIDADDFTTTTTTTTTTPVPTTAIPTTTPTPTTTTIPAPNPTKTIKPDPCSGCKMSNGIGYNPHPIDCRKYIQCEFGLNGVINSVVQECGHGLFWDQDLLTCNYPAAVQCAADPCKNMYSQTYKNGGNCREYYGCVNGSSVGQCCAKGNAYVSGRCVYNQGCDAYCSGDVVNTVCDKRAVSGNKRVFEQLVSDYQWVSMPCAPGTAYNSEDCGCTVLADSVAIPVTHQCRRIVYLPFDKDVSDQSGNGNYVENIGVTVSGGSAYFDGKSGLRIPRFANVEFGTKFVIKLTYRNDGVSDKPEAVVSNGDCGKPQTLLIASYKHTTMFGLQPVTGRPRVVSIPSTVGWNNIIFKIQDNHLSGSVNGNEARTANDGDVKRSQCALQIGRGTSLNNFRGYMDEFSVYMC
ncbi:protein PIF isoform X2 [Patella vulgata]|uniref:protein PIF isoform X2 n=1 Tax=Patella vulgata TaxID=6465 RepID=UPI0021806BA8|nr:protein PIF isoform X2 [Patella vulgata]